MTCHYCNKPLPHGPPVINPGGRSAIEFAHLMKVCFNDTGFPWQRYVRLYCSSHCRDLARMGVWTSSEPITVEVVK